MDVDRDNEQFNNGVTHTVELLARIIGATGWIAGDGSEDYDEDLGQTLLNILAAKGLFDPDTASYAALPAQEWQDISTAPKDGKPILICGGTFEYTGGVFTSPKPFQDVEIVRWDGSCWEGPYGSEYDERYLFQPTHWRALPKPHAALIADDRAAE